jgi:hypothetical protein
MFKKLLAVTLLTLAANSAQAELYNIDAFTDGDKKGAFVDTLNVAWLDLDLNFSTSFAQALSDYPDYRLATNSEVETLFNSAFPSLASAEVNNFNGNSTSSRLTPELRAEMLNWADAFGFSVDNSNYSFGRYYDEDATVRTLGIRNTAQSFSSWFIAGTEHSSTYSTANQGVVHSVFLVKDLNGAELSSARSQSGLAATNVPFAGLGALSLLALAGLRRQRQA